MNNQLNEHNYYLVTCCDTVMVENFDGQTYRHGLYTPMAGGISHNGAPVYKQEGGSNQLWYEGSVGGWSVGPDYSTGSFGIRGLVVFFFKLNERKIHTYLYRKEHFVRRMFQVGNIMMGFSLMMKMLMCVAVTVLSNPRFKNAVRL